MIEPARFRQPSHGFAKLTAVVATSGGFRRCNNGETPHAIVARVYDANTFALITSGEIDGLSGIEVGQFYGLDGSGNLVVGGFGNVAVGCRETTLFVLSQSVDNSSASTPVDLSEYQQTSEKAAPDGYAPLDSDAKVPLVNLPTSYLLNPQNFDLSKVIVDKENGTFVMDTSTDPTSFVIP